MEDFSAYCHKYYDSEDDDNVCHMLTDSEDDTCDDYMECEECPWFYADDD